MLDLILGWWNDLRPKTKIIIALGAILSMLGTMMYLSVSFGVNDVFDQYMRTREEEVVLNSKYNFYKEYSEQKMAQAKQDEISGLKEQEQGQGSGFTGTKIEGEFEYIGTTAGHYIPYMIQGDSRWGATPVRGNSPPDTIADNGCGLTSLAMIKSYITGDFITPIDIYNELPANQFQGEMGWDAPATILEPLGYSVVNFGENPMTEASWDRFYEGLENGAIGMVSFKPGEFTGGGHIGVIKGTDGNGSVWLNDPNSGNKHFCESPRPKAQMLGNCKQFWLITKN